MLNPVVLRSADRTVKASDAQLRCFLGVRQRKREGERGADREAFDRASDSLVALSVPVLARSNTASPSRGQI